MPPETSDKYRVHDIDFYARTAGGMRIHPVEIEYITSRHNEAAELYVLGFTKSGKVPKEGAGVAFYSAGAGIKRNDLTIGHETKEGEDLVIGQGAIASSWKTQEGLIGIEAYDGIRRMKNRPFTNDYSEDGVAPEKVAEAIFRRAGVSFDTDVVDQFAPRHRQNIPEGALDDLNININFNTNCADAMNRLSQNSGGGWYFTHKNDGIYTTNPDSVLHNVNGILDDNSGGQELPYTKVKVYGSRQNPKSGLIANDPVIGTAGEGNPTYETTVNSIHNDHQAKLLAEEILLEFRRQRSTGTIKMVGDEYIRPLDGISLPDHAGGGDYLVGGVTHRINNDDGFITEIDCNGFVGFDKEQLPERERDLDEQ